MKRQSSIDVEKNVALNDNNVISFLENVLYVKIKEVIFIELLTMNRDFFLYKYQLKLENEKNRIVYLKAVRNDRIKESLFFYWCILCEEESKGKEIENKINKVNIKQEEIDEYKRVVLLEIDNNNTEMLKNGTRVFFLDILKYFKKEKIQVLNEIINKNQILLLGTK